jgi:drug/metabolite transporter (DMT)-like permease
MVVATLLGACSSLYDKYLLQTRNFSTATVQAWFAIYLVPMMIPISIIWLVRQRQQSRFEWRWSIPAIAMLLLISDFLYFYAIEQPGALMAVISPLRRTSVIVSFVAGVLIYGEKNWRQKAICIATLLVGVCVISLLGD